MPELMNIGTWKDILIGGLDHTFSRFIDATSATSHSRLISLLPWKRFIFHTIACSAAAPDDSTCLRLAISHLPQIYAMEYLVDNLDWLEDVLEATGVKPPRNHHVTTV